jgi:plastocyanin
VITITNFQYSPADLAVKPGTTVTVVNHDADAHSVTSQSTANAFTPGAVAGIHFDTGSFHTTATFSLPATALPGTVIPYFCTVHGTMAGMGTGRITIVPP